MHYSANYLKNKVIKLILYGQFSGEEGLLNSLWDAIILY